MRNSASEYLGGNAVVVDEPGMPWSLRVPEGWEVDTSGAKDGALVVDLAIQHMGLESEPAVYRLAMYNTAEEVPVRPLPTA